MPLPTTTVPRPAQPPRDQPRMLQSPQPTGFGSGGGLNADGSGRKKKRRRKNKGSGGAPSQGEQVLLVDPSQQGISLNAMLPRSAPQSDRPRGDARPPRPQSPREQSSRPEPINLGITSASRQQPTITAPTPFVPPPAPLSAPRPVTSPPPLPPRAEVTPPPAISPRPQPPTPPTQLQPGQVVKLDQN